MHDFSPNPVPSKIKFIDPAQVNRLLFNPASKTDDNDWSWRIIYDAKIYAKYDFTSLSYQTMHMC